MKRRVILSPKPAVAPVTKIIISLFLNCFQVVRVNHITITSCLLKKSSLPPVCINRVQGCTVMRRNGTE